MSLFCPECSYVPAEPDEPWCHRCGHNFVSEPDDATGLIPAISRAVSRRGEVVVNRFRVNCACYGEQLRFDPVDEAMSSRFQCGKFPGRIDCVACPICSGCGQLKCSCGFLGIEIEVKLPPTIETVAIRDRLE